MNADHLRPVLDSHVHSDLLFKLGEQLSRADASSDRGRDQVGKNHRSPETQRRSEGDRGG